LLAVIGEFLDQSGSRINEEPVQALLVASVAGDCDRSRGRSRSCSQYDDEDVDSGVGHPCTMSSEGASDAY